MPCCYAEHRLCKTLWRGPYGEHRLCIKTAPYAYYAGPAQPLGRKGCYAVHRLSNARQDPRPCTRQPLLHIMQALLHIMQALLHIMQALMQAPMQGC